MNKYVIKNNIVIAQHEGSQEIENAYPDCTFLVTDENIAFGMTISDSQSNEAEKQRLLKQIKDIQINKLPRAFFEPSEKEPGLTWLDYYNQQIAELRVQVLASMKGII